MRNLILIIAIFVTLSSCKVNGEKGSIFDLFPEVEELKITSKTLLEDFYDCTSSSMQIYEDKLILSGRNNSPYYYYIFDINSGKQLNQLIARGKGYNEEVYLYGFYSNTNSICYFTNYSSMQICKIDCKELLLPSPSINIEKDEFVKINDFNFFPSESCAISDGRYIFGGYSETTKNILMLIDSTGKEIDTFSTLPFEEDIDPYAAHSTFFGCQTNLSNDRLLACTSGYGAYQFFNCSDKEAQPKLIKEIIYEIPTYKVERNNNCTWSSRSDNGKIGNSAITSSEDYFYITTINNTIAELRTGEVEADIRILVFDKNGEPVKIFIPEGELAHITYDPNSNSLCTLTEEEEGVMLVKYKL